MTAIRLIGIDPGLRHTGWGVIEVDGSRLIHVAHGVLSPDPDQPMVERLVALHDGVRDLVALHAPLEAAVESTFVSRDAAASLKLGQARGAVLVALAKAGLLCADYAPNLIKKSVVGRGHAEKGQIGMMVATLLRTDGIASPDAADALAAAITHAHHRSARIVGRPAA